MATLVALSLIHDLYKRNNTVINFDENSCYFKNKRTKIVFRKPTIFFPCLEVLQKHQQHILIFTYKWSIRFNIIDRNYENNSNEIDNNNNQRQRQREDVERQRNLDE
ncbi:hypothetical protein Glove_325g12 [Diversispora epigaea]|uniref:Uncharacterized protein n=1 Tax=Diversispora epigaea TaxID=1348612 RepID=A0A397HSX3_9GLOM|nr:hypothetical protein Glove_325g12 [Diversispora epigaea]